MLILQMRRAGLKQNQLKLLDKFITSVPATFRPLIHPTIASQATILGIPPGGLRKPAEIRESSFQRRLPLRDGEVFTYGTSLYVVTVSEPEPRRARLARRGLLPGDEGAEDGDAELTLSYIGPERESDGLRALEALVNDAFGVKLKPTHYKSAKFDELKSEGQVVQLRPSSDESACARLLVDRTTRALALAVKSSGGLLVRDLPNQLAPQERSRTESIRNDLLSAKLISADVFVICSKSQTTTARVPSKAALEELASKGLRCACGRPITEERIEEALTISDRGRTLLDGSRWLTMLLLEELQAIGVPLDRILVEKQAGGDELDCVADISGELALFELKDKEFSLGNAYSFGAKIGIVRPEHPVIISTERVGNDAKEHFQRARLSRKSSAGDDEEFAEDDERAEIQYIEGLDHLREGVQALATEIYQGDAVRILSRVLPLASIDPGAVVRAVTARVPKLEEEVKSSPTTDPPIDKNHKNSR